MQNISKYVQVNDFLLLEYEFSRDDVTTSIGDGYVVTTDLGVKQYFDNDESVALGNTNNMLELNATPTVAERSVWFNDYESSPLINAYNPYFDSSIVIGSINYPHDTIKVHIVSGYNFDDVAGFLLEIRANDASSNLVDLSNFTYIKQPETQGSDVVKFSSNALYLGNRFYDKYVELKVPSVYALGADTAGGFDTSLGQALAVNQLSDVYLTYSTIPTVQKSGFTNSFTLYEHTDFQLPVTSSADNFNAFIAESTVGDFIEFYGTWKDEIIGQYMGDIESGRIPLYTSNNPNDNYEEFSEIYGATTAKWVLIHEIYVYENLAGGAGGSSLLTQKYTFTQEDNFSLPNYFRPVLKNADIDSSYTIQYICRLSNRMDGTQIIRRASFASTDPKKYGLRFTRLNVENIIPYKVFNRIEGEKANIIQGNLKPKTKYSKVFYDTTNILYNENDEVYPNGIGPLFLKNGDSVYKFKFERFNEAADERENVDLSGVYNYALLFVKDDDVKIEVVPTYSRNMNTTIGELEFKLTGDQIITLLKQKNNKYTIVIKNPDGTSYTFYEGEYFDNGDMIAVLNRYDKLNVVSDLRKENTQLKQTQEELIQMNNKLSEQIGRNPYLTGGS